MNNKVLWGAVAVVVVLILGYWYMTSESPMLNADNDGESQTNQMGNLNSGENPEPGSTVHDLPVEPAAAKARADLAAKLGLPESRIVIMLVEEKTWSDGCLGLGGPAESCIAALVEGFRVELVAEGKTYVYRTDKTGASVRAETQ